MITFITVEVSCRFAEILANLIYNSVARSGLVWA